MRSTVLFRVLRLSLVSLLLVTAPTSRGAAPTPVIEQEPGGDVKQKEIDDLPFDDLKMDAGFVGPVSAGLDHLDEDRRRSLDEWQTKLMDWGPGKREEAGSVGQRVRNLLTLCAMADMGRSEFEGETAYVVFQMLRNDTPKDKLARACAWVALRPAEGTVVMSASELGMEVDQPEEALRDRTALYAAKLLGRATGKIPWGDEEAAPPPESDKPTTKPATQPATATATNRS